MAGMKEPGLSRLGLGVSKFTVPNDRPTHLEMISYFDMQSGEDDGRALRSTWHAQGGEIAFPGGYRLAEMGYEGAGSAMELEVAKVGRHGLELTLRRDGEVAARGLGLADPDDPRSVMASWWTGDVEPYGVVKYSIRDGRTIEGYYISKMTPDAPGRDVALGDTAGGFPGSYTLQSREVNGRTWGPHHWVLNMRGDIVEATWSEDGKVFCRGFGIVDPHDPSSFIATYIAL